MAKIESLRSQIMLCVYRNGWDGDVCTKNGPLLFTNLMKKYCKTEDVPSMYSVNCGKFTVLCVPT